LLHFVAPLALAILALGFQYEYGPAAPQLPESIATNVGVGPAIKPTASGSAKIPPVICRNRQWQPRGRK
jgi:hypothetical protein